MAARLKRIPLAVLALLLLAGCGGKPLPAGMEEAALLEAGRDVVLLLVGGDYEEVHALLRADVAEGVTAADLQGLALRQLDGAGVYRQIESSMTTGQSSDGEDYGVAVLYCSFTEDTVLFRLAFDPDMELIGLEIKRQ